MSSTIQLRRGTSDQWALHNPVLAPGEPGVELPDRLLKIGDGITPWSDLPAADAADLTALQSEVDTLETTVTGKVDTTTFNTALASKVNATLLAQPNGVATLDANGKVPLVQFKDDKIAVNVMDPAFGGGAKGDNNGSTPSHGTDDSNPIQLAIDYVDKYLGGDPALESSYGSFRGGYVLFPLGRYRVTKSIYTEARVRLVGIQAGAFGGATSALIADPAGDYTNGPYSEKFVLKMGRRSTGGYWWHSGTWERMMIDVQQAPGVGGFHCWGAGENSIIDNVQVVNTGWTERTVTDVVFVADSKQITSVTAAFTQDDVGGRVTTNDAVGFPTSWTSKAMTDAVWNKGSNKITSATAAFTSADKGKQLVWQDADNGQGLPLFVVSVDSATQVTMSEEFKESKTAGAGGTWYLRKPVGLRIEQVVNATTAILTRPAVSGGTGASVKFRRGRPGVQFHDGGATMRIGSLNVSANSGPGLHIVGGDGGLWIEELTGDNNGGALLRIQDTGSSGDTPAYNVGIKAENNDYGVGNLEAMADHDPVVLLDGCGAMRLHVFGSANASARGSKAVVRIDRSNNFAAGVPSVELDVEGGNPYNPEFWYEVFDTATGRNVKVPQITDTARLNPKILWNRDVIFGGNFEDTLNLNGEFLQKVRRDPKKAEHVGTELWNHVIPGHHRPNKSPHGTWEVALIPGGYMIGNMIGYNWTNANLDENHWYHPLSAGTWSFEANSWSQDDGAIIEFAWSQDGGVTWNTIATLDTYGPTQGMIGTPTVSGIVIPASGLTITRVKVNGRNASNTTGYYGRMVEMRWTRTS